MPLRRLLLIAFLFAACLGPRNSVAETLSLEQVAPGVYVHQGRHEEMSKANLAGIANLSFVVGQEAVAVIDSGGSAQQGAQLRAAVRNVTDLPIRYVINTHVHPDHLFGNSAFLEDSPEFVGHAKLPRALAARGPFYLDSLAELLGEAFDGTEVVAPTLTVESELVLDLGGRSLRLIAHPTAHTDNDLSVLDLESGTLWLGDLLFMTRIPVIDGSLNGWLAVMERLSGLNAQRVVPGHGPASAPWPQALDDQRRYLETLQSEIRARIAEADTMEAAVETVGRSEEDRWLLFEDYHARNIVTGFAELEWE